MARSKKAAAAAVETPVAGNAGAVVVTPAFDVSAVAPIARKMLATATATADSEYGYYCDWASFGSDRKPSDDDRKVIVDAIKAVLTGEGAGNGALSEKSATAKASACWKFIQCGRRGLFPATLAAFGKLNGYLGLTKGAALSRVVTAVNSADDAKRATILGDLPKWFGDELADQAKKAAARATASGIVDSEEKALNSTLNRLAKAMHGKTAAKAFRKADTDHIGKLHAAYVEALRSLLPDSDTSDTSDTSEPAAVAVPAGMPAGDKVDAMINQIVERRLAAMLAK